MRRSIRFLKPQTFTKRTMNSNMQTRVVSVSGKRFRQVVDTSQDNSNDNKTNTLERRIVVGNANFRYLIGAQGSTRKRIENESSVELIIPDRNSTSNEVTIYGATEEILDNAEQNIQNTIAQAQHPQSKQPSNQASTQQRPTHFLSLPLNTIEVQDQLKQLYSDIQKLGTYETSLFMKPVRFHVTLCMLRIPDSNTKRKIIQVMNDRIAPLVQAFDATDFLTLNRIETFAKAKIHQASVLYFAAKESDSLTKLHDLVKQLKDILLEEGLITDASEEFKFHATIINTKYRAQAESKLKKNSHMRSRPVDGTPVFNKYGTLCEDMAAIKIPLRTIELSSLSFGKNHDPETQFYPCEHKIDFPK